MLLFSKYLLFTAMTVAPALAIGFEEYASFYRKAGLDAAVYRHYNVKPGDGTEYTKWLPENAELRAQEDEYLLKLNYKKAAIPAGKGLLPPNLREKTYSEQIRRTHSPRRRR